MLFGRFCLRDSSKLYVYPPHYILGNPEFRGRENVTINSESYGYNLPNAHGNTWVKLNIFIQEGIRRIFSPGAGYGNFLPERIFFLVRVGWWVVET